MTDDGLPDRVVVNRPAQEVDVERGDVVELENGAEVLGAERRQGLAGRRRDFLVAFGGEESQHPDEVLATDREQALSREEPDGPRHHALAHPAEELTDAGDRLLAHGEGDAARRSRRRESDARHRPVLADTVEVLAEIVDLHRTGVTQHHVDILARGGDLPGGVCGEQPSKGLLSSHPDLDPTRPSGRPDHQDLWTRSGRRKGRRLGCRRRCRR